MPSRTAWACARPGCWICTTAAARRSCWLSKWPVNCWRPGEGRTALIAIAQNAAGQIFDQPGVRRKAQSSVPGDGAAVGLVTLSDESPILDIECRTYGEYAGDMTLAIDPPRKWWQPGPGEGSIGFTETRS